MIVTMKLKTQAVRDHNKPIWTTLAALTSPAITAESLVHAGLSNEAASAKSELMARSAQKLIDLGHEADAVATAVYVPGRIEIFGKHTDYCGGRSLLCAVDRGLCMVAVRSKSRQQVRITEIKSSRSIEFEQSAAIKPVADGWPNYPMATARRIARDFPDVQCGGVDIAFAGDLPLAAGLSSSSTLIVATWLTLAAFGGLFDHSMYKQYLGTIEELVTYFGAIEAGRVFGPFAADGGVGTTGGSQDHAAMVLCRAGELSQVSYSPLQIERAVPLSDKWKFVIAVSGVVAEKTGTAMAHYNGLSARARQVLKIWNEHTGRQDATLVEALDSATDAADRIYSYIDGMTEGADGQFTLTNRLRQFILESYQLVPSATDAIASEDMNKFGQLTAQSQKAAEQWLGSQVPETIALPESARELGAIAASSFGAGFGGSCWALVSARDVADFGEKWLASYRSRVDPDTADRACVWVTDAGPGALWLGAD